MSTPDQGAAIPSGDAANRALLFTIEGREFALPVESVVEVVRHRQATPVPRASSVIEGVVAIRGQMVTLVDLRGCLDLPARRAGAPSRVIVVDTADDRVGLIVDRVSGVSPSGGGATLLDVGEVLRGIP